MKKPTKPQPTLGTRVHSILLARGPLNSDAIAKIVRAPASSVSSACSRLFKAGRVIRTDKGGRGREAVWKALKRARKIAPIATA